MNGKRKMLWLIAIIPITALAWLYRLNQYPKGYYGNPLDIPVELAANFGEVRADHFHMGLDIRTNGKENLPVYTAADGFISRVTIEEAGFGKAVYITHPNGTITVYGHLNHFMPALENYVISKQYKDESWLQDVHFTANIFPVKKGMLVAYSGNTGSSEGPHLHFEIRDAHTGNNLNPLLNGFELKDNVPPVIHCIYWYDRTKSIYETEAVPIALKADGNQYSIADNVIIVTCPAISFGMGVTDKNAGTKYRLGIYKAMLFKDDSLAFCFALNRFCYKDTRYVNACIDYNKWFEQSKCIQLLCKLPDDRLPVFEGSPGDGVLHLEDRKVHSIKITVSDAAGNMATVCMKIQFDGTKQKLVRAPEGIHLLLPGKAVTVRSANAEVTFSSNSVYDTVPFTMHEEPSTEMNAASNYIYIHHANVPVHDFYKIRIRTTLPPGSPLRKCTVMRLFNDKHTFIVKGKWKGDVMEGCFTELGTAQLAIDTSAPDLQCKEGDNARFAGDDKALHIVYSDNLSDAASFMGTVDGHWVLFEKKGHLFTYYFDEHGLSGKHVLQFTASDIAGNVTSKTFVFWKE